MARRSIATVKRPKPHLYTADPTDSGDRTGARPCSTCGLPERNGVHEPTDTSAEQDEHRRRYGEDS